MTEGPGSWEELVAAVDQLDAALRRQTADRINSPTFKAQALACVQGYFRHIRPEFMRLDVDEEAVESLDSSFQQLNEYRQGRVKKTSYRSCIKAIKRSLSDLSVTRDQIIGLRNFDRANVKTTDLQEQIISTMQKLIPSAAMSFRQALNDLNDESRSSFRGTATELREALREVVDHFAPDEDVIASPNFKLEKDRTKPTMRQKVQFIFKQRGQKEVQHAATKDTIAYIEAVPDKLARSLYNRSSLSTHVATSKREVLSLLRYIEPLLADLLEV